MVALVILTIGLVSLAELLAVSLRLQQLGRNGTAAVRIAQDKLDWLETANFTTEPAIQIAPGGSLTADVANYNDVDVQGYKRRWRVQPGPDGDPDLRMVTIRVIPDSTDRRTVSPYDLVSIIRR